MKKTTKGNERIGKSPKKVLVIKEEGRGEARMSKKEMAAQKRAEVLKAVIGALKKPKIDVQAYAKKLFKDNLDRLKAYKVTYDEKGLRKEERVAFDALEMPNQAPLTTGAELSYDIVSKFDQTFLGWQNLAILQQNGLIDKICSLPAHDAMATGYKLSYGRNKKEVDAEELEDLERRSNTQYGIERTCVQATRNKRIFGYGLVVPNFEENIDMEKPFTEEAVKGKTYLGMTVVDPNWVTYDFDERSLVDTAYRYFYEPTWYRFSAGDGVQTIHRTWIVKLVNSEVSDIMKPAYFFGGVSTIQQVYEAVYAYEKALNEAILLLLTKRTYVVDAEMANYIANPQEVTSVLDAMALLHNNYGYLAKETGTEVKQMDTALTGMQEIIGCLFERVAGIAEMTREKLLNTPVSGFNSSGKFEDKDYKEHLMRIQKYDFQPILAAHYRYMTLSEQGKAIPLEVTFNPVDTPDQETTAKIREMDAKTLMLLAGAKILSKEEVRDTLRNDPNSGLSTIPVEMPDISNNELDDDFSVEKDNQGRPMPKPKDDVIRGKTKEDLQ